MSGVKEHFRRFFHKENFIFKIIFSIRKSIFSQKL